MTGVEEWGAMQEIKRRTHSINQNLNTWEEGDVYHFYDDLEIMFKSLCDDQSVLSRRQIRLVDAARMSFDKMFNRQKNNEANTNKSI